MRIVGGPRLVALLGLAATALLVAFLASRPDPTSVDGSDLDEERGPAGRAPGLVEGPASLPGAGQGRRAGASTTPDPAAPETPDPAEGALLEGTVLDDESGRPVAGATVVARRAGPDCPAALPTSLVFAEGTTSPGTVTMTVMEGTDRELVAVPVPTVTARTGEDGAFALPWTAGAPADLWARRRGYVVGSVCRVGTAAPVTLRLVRGLRVTGRVVREDGTPIPGAQVACHPDPGAQGDLGHHDATTTDEQGAFALEGLLAGPVRVEVDHPRFVPFATVPLEPPARDLRIVLVPAFLARIRITTDDAKEPDAPTASWKTTGNPPREGLELLRRADLPRLPDVPVVGPALATPGDFGYEPLPIPCDRPAVTFTVKAVGYEPWTSDPVELPREGGEQVLAVALRRDPDLGRVRVLLEAPDGRPLSYVQEGCDLEIGRRDAVAVPAGIVLKPSEALELPALPSGPYRMRILSAKHAPALLDVDVPAGGTEERRVTLGPPAKVHVKFTAPEVVLVRFLVRQGGRTVRTYPEGPGGLVGGPGEPAPAETDEQASQAGSGGIVLTGLAAGRYTIEVISPDLVATPTGVDLVEGETKEVEISVARR